MLDVVVKTREDMEHFEEKEKEGRLCTGNKSL